MSWPRLRYRKFITLCVTSQSGLSKQHILWCSMLSIQAALHTHGVELAYSKNLEFTKFDACFERVGRKSLSTGPYCTAVLVINRLSRSAWRLSFGVTADVWCSIIIVILSPPHMPGPYGYCKSGSVCVCCLPFCPAHVKPIMSCSKLISRSQKRSTIFNTSTNFKSIVQQKLRIDCDVSWSNHQSNGQRCEIGLDADLIMTVFWVEFHHSSDYCWLNGVESLSKFVQKLLDMFKYRQIAKKHLLEPSP